VKRGKKYYINSSLEESGDGCMKCPVDTSVDLKPQNYEANIQIDFCPRCRGVWLDQGELEAIQGTLEKDYSEILEELARERLSHEVGGAEVEEGSSDSFLLTEADLPQDVHRHCPKCNGSVMVRSFYKTDNAVVIDVCPTCHGIWLDEGELQKLEVLYQESLTRYEEGVRLGVPESELDDFQEGIEKLKANRLTMIAIWGELLLKRFRDQERR